MNEMEKISKCQIPYEGKQTSILKYMSMKQRMKMETVSVDQIFEFFSNKFERKDNVRKMLMTMEKNGFVEKNEIGYVITNLGKRVPFIVAQINTNKLIKEGKRSSFANEKYR